MVGFGWFYGGAIFGVIAGWLLGHGFTYTTLFFLAGSFHLIGFSVLSFWGGKIQPLRSKDLLTLENSI